MASRSAGGPAGHDDDEQVAQATDRLFAAPLDAFVALRREIAAALKQRGDLAGSRRVAAMAKPSRTAWALNQVARQRPEVVKAALDAHAKAQAVQAAGDADAMRASARLYRERVATVVETAEELFRGDGRGGLVPAQGRRIGATLQAIASGGDPTLREALVKGRLVTDVDDDEPFAGLELGTGSRRSEGAIRSPPAVASGSTHEARTKRDAEAVAARARAAEREAERERHARAQEREKKRARLAALEAEVKEARASAREAEVVATRAQSDAERARRAVEALEKRVDEARRELRGVDG